MRALARLSTLAAAVALSACGGGGGGDSSPAPAPSAPAAAPSPTTLVTDATALPQPVIVTGAPPPASTRLAFQTSVPEPVYSMPLGAEIFRAVNTVRANAGIGLLRQESRMDQAAAAHVAYMVRNNSGGHAETPGLPLFTGVNLVERLAAAGYTGGYVWENVSPAEAKSSGWDIVVQLYMSTPYHRVPFLVADSTSIGIGVDRPVSHLSVNTMLFGFAASAPQQLGASKLVVWPYAGMPDSPTQGCCEVPNPFAGARHLWGYPVSLHGPAQSRIAVSSFRLSGPDGTVVDAHLLTAQNDPNRLLDESAVVLIPLSPLAKAANYTATAEGTLDGVAFNKSWSFTTRAN